MKFWKRLQFVLCLMAYLCVLVLVIKNIAIGTIGINGISFAVTFLSLLGLIVLLSGVEIKEFNDNENRIKKVNYEQDNGKVRQYREDDTDRF